MELAACACRFSKVENLKDQAAAAAQAILEPGMEGDSSKNMTREAFGTFMQRFASASGLSFKDLSNFLLVMPRYNFDVDLNDPGGDGSWLLFCYAVTTLHWLRPARLPID